MNKTIGIIGCGWLGYPLAKTFVQEGYTVHGSSTSLEKLERLQQANIRPYHIELSATQIKGDIAAFLKNVSILIVNVPPKLRGAHNENYVAKMELLATALKVSSVTKVLFVSSTSVYGDSTGTVTEQTPTQPNTESGKQLVASEQLFWKAQTWRTTIVRFGGLINDERHPVHHLAGKKGLSNGNDVVNLIHLDDCIRILKAIIEDQFWGEICNAVYPYHPSKNEYYSQMAQQKGLELPEYTSNNATQSKRVLSSRLLFVKKFNFKTYIGG
ncbi:SDR family oxidoreductase [Arenibacter sp. GZD96]|uniref:SDR family oxidoreductase n=1 Tax=Aurantibrevibacter litoralis TaxID=3106030 RepID=UPI002AFEC7F9|nr:SDR family oxidoreductase [Arenibacter sp. GZD-96]MEA1787576.1 SDR family oxidoreductase [Arenibacter sp. GZD-96]